MNAVGITTIAAFTVPLSEPIALHVPAVDTNWWLLTICRQIRQCCCFPRSRNSDSISMANPFIIMDSASDFIHPITIQVGRILCFAWNAILPFRKLRTAIAAAAEASTVPKPSRINCFTSCVNAYAMLPNMANKDTVKRGCQWLAPTYYE